MKMELLCWKSEMGSLLQRLVRLYCTVIILASCHGAGETDTNLGNHAELSSEDRSYCDTQAFSASCDPGEVILMTKAMYGRMSLGRCAKLTYGYLGCASDVIEFVDTRCSGRRTCELRIADDNLVSLGECPDDLRSYLEAEYQCVKVQSSNASCRSGHAVKTKSMRGVLANVVTEATGCGSSISPWLIQVLPGQSISVTLYDFNVEHRKRTATDSSGCHMYAMIQERLRTGTRNVTVCGGTAREKLYFTSKSNQIAIGLTQNDEEGNTPYYFLRYEAVGCADIPAPANSELKRHGNIISVKCNHSNDAYELRCIGNQWIGKEENCSGSLLQTDEQLNTDSGGIPYGMSILIVLAIALTIGLLVLLAGLIFLRRHWGLCTGRRAEQNRSIARQDYDDKDYVSSMWIRSRDSPDSRKNWREGDSFSTYTTSELPPCTPLMERGTRPPLYGQVQQKLPCGCPAYVENTDVATYLTRQQLLQNSGGRQEKLILKPGEPTQYFIVDSDTSCQKTQSPSKLLADCGGGSENLLDQPCCSNDVQGRQPDIKPSRPNVVMQTDDIKLRLRISDVPCSNTVQLSERHPLVENDSNSSKSLDRQLQSDEYSQAGPIPDVSYPAVCKERMENEVNDVSQPVPIHTNVKGHPTSHQVKGHSINKCPHMH